MTSFTTGYKQFQQGRLPLLPAARDEVVPALEDAWLTGEEGHYDGEFILPLLLRAASERPSTSEHSVAEYAAAAVSARRRPPGSEWLFAKLCCPGRREDELIGDSLAPFANNAIASGLADSWFYIRNRDPEGHIRLRLNGTPDRLSNQLFGQVRRWAEGSGYARASLSTHMTGKSDASAGPMR